MSPVATGTTSAGLYTLDDFARVARERLDPHVWDFLDGGSGVERALAGNVAAFDRVTLRPRVLAGVGQPDTSIALLGRQWAAPLAVAPMAYHTLVHADGEVATARAAAAAGLPLVVSTFAGRAFNDIAAAGAPLWLQVYCFRDRATTRSLIHHAQDSGFEALVLTVDAPRLGKRLRDLRNDFRLPPGVAPANLAPGAFESPSGHALAEFDPALDWSVVDWLRSVSRLPVLLKGILTADDALRARDAGVDGIIVSNHGGRQLDCAPATLDVLPEIASAVAGTCPVLMDGGVRRGSDVLAALALGADAVLVGRPVLYGLTVDGEAGVGEVLRVLNEELVDAMVLTGTRTVADAGRQLVDAQFRTTAIRWP